MLKPLKPPDKKSELDDGLLPLTVCEVRRLLWRLLWKCAPVPAFVFAWSRWRTWILHLLASVLVAGPLRKEKALNAQIQTPDSFQWMTPEQQQQYMQNSQPSPNALTTRFAVPFMKAING